MRSYLDLVKTVIDTGFDRMDRTGVGTLSVFSPPNLKFDLSKGFPIVTTKKILFEKVVEELLWFIKGGHNINDPEAPTKIWDAWADPETGDLGRIYGVQWRSWRYKDQEIDQLTDAIKRAKNVPNSRRNMVLTWNPGEIKNKELALEPCHMFFQLNVREVRNHLTYLDLTMYQRSADLCLGVPFNISSYALLLSMIANECGYQPGIYTHMFGDAHVYKNHIDKFLSIQYPREPFALPTLHLPIGKKVIDITADDIVLKNYWHHSFVKYPIAV